MKKFTNIIVTNTLATPLIALSAGCELNSSKDVRKATEIFAKVNVTLDASKNKNELFASDIVAADIKIEVPSDIDKDFKMNLDPSSFKFSSSDYTGNLDVTVFGTYKGIQVNRIVQFDGFKSFAQTLKKYEVNGKKIDYFIRPTLEPTFSFANTSLLSKSLKNSVFWTQFVFNTESNYYYFNVNTQNAFVKDTVNVSNAVNAVAFNKITDFNYANEIVLAQEVKGKGKNNSSSFIVLQQPTIKGNDIVIAFKVSGEHTDSNNFLVAINKNELEKLTTVAVKDVVNNSDKLKIIYGKTISEVSDIPFQFVNETVQKVAIFQKMPNNQNATIVVLKDIKDIKDAIYASTK